MPGSPSVGLLVNERSRSGAAAFASARQTLTAAGLSLAEAERTASAEDFRERLRAWVAAGIGLVAVGGGDGTLSAAAGLLSGSRTVLGIIPLGTGNDFARGLALPLGIAAACGVIAHGRTVPVDVARVNGRVFLVAVNAGVSADVTRGLNPALKRVAGPLAYVLAATRAAWTHRPFEVCLTVDGDRRDPVMALQAVIGNGRFQAGGGVIDPEASADDAVLHGYLVRSRSGPHRSWSNVVTLTGVGLATRFGRHLDHPEVVRFTGRAVRLDSAPSRTLGVDGELEGSTPALVEIVPAGLSVRVPLRMGAAGFEPATPAV